MSLFSDRTLSQKLEQAEARANAHFIDARAKITPNNGAQWIQIKGTYVLFDGAQSPLTQTFGLSLFEEATHQDLCTIETFFQERNSSVFHEVSPMACPSHMSLLHERGYKPIELTNVMVKALSKDNILHCSNPSEVIVRPLGKGEETLWARTSSEGWSTETDGLSDFMYQFASIAAQSTGAYPFFGIIHEKIIATGMLHIANEVALLAGASTIPEGRNQGAQNALLNARLDYAKNQDCTLAMMCASPGSQSPKNAEKRGFKVAYTRTKWQL